MKLHLRASSLCLPAFAVLALAALADYASASAIYSVDAKQVIYEPKQPKGLKAWPDGNFGIINNGNGTYDFYAANSSKSQLTTGTLDNPAAGKKKNVTISNVPKKTYKYLAGGPIYQDPATGTRLMVYHAEIHDKTKYSSVLGLAVSTDKAGTKFRDLGTIIEPNMPHLQAGFSVDVGGGSFAIKDGYFNVYYRDYMSNGVPSELAVARAPLSQLINNALGWRSTPFTKYYNGAWSQPGKGGKASALEIGNKPNWWSSVSYNEYLNQMVLVTSQWQAAGTLADLYMATSSDGVNWSPRVPIVTDAGEQMYPTIVGTGANPLNTGKSFWVYYTDGDRWGGASLARRLITLDPATGLAGARSMQSFSVPEPGTFCMTLLALAGIMAHRRR